MADSEDRFLGTMRDLRHALDGSSRYDVQAQQGGAFRDLTPSLVLGVECFVQMNVWRIRLAFGDDVVAEWLVKSRPLLHAFVPARVGLYRALEYFLTRSFTLDSDDRTRWLGRLFDSGSLRADELRLAHLMELLAAQWVQQCEYFFAAVHETGFSDPRQRVPDAELAVMQAYFSTVPAHDWVDRYGEIQAEILDNDPSETSWDDCYVAAGLWAQSIGAPIPPPPPWPSIW